MARVVEVTTPFEKTEKVLSALKDIREITELHLEKNISIQPPGDLITISIPTKELQNVMRVLDAQDLGKEGGVSVTTSEPDSVIATSSNYHIDRDNNEASWEEMEMLIAKDSNSTINTLFLMFFAGALAVTGIATNSLHIVIGGMLVAPGFMPIMRITLGLITKNKIWHRGIIDVFKGYIVLMIGATVAGFVLEGFGYDVLSGEASYYLLNKPLVEYWSSTTTASVIASIAASFAGALMIVSKRSVFTSGVMIALALVPSAALIGVAAVMGNQEVALGAAKRFLIDVLLVLVCPAFIFFFWRIMIHKRNMNL